MEKHKDLKERGVVTASAGNFGQGLAWYCAEFSIPCTAIVPLSAPRTKVDGMIRLGAKIIHVPFSTWWKIIETHDCTHVEEMKITNSIFVHPGAENSVLAGNATIALEVLDEMPDIDCIIAPYGSGALVTGIACGVRAILRERKLDERSVRVIAVEPETASPFCLSLRNGKVTKFKNYQSSFVDGCGGKAVLPSIWNLARNNVDDGVAVSLQKIKDAICIMLEKNHVVAEGAGACPLAAVLEGKCEKYKNIVCVVSGGGLDTNTLITFLNESRIIRKKKSSGCGVSGIWLAVTAILSISAAASAAGYYYYSTTAK